MNEQLKEPLPSVWRGSDASIAGLEPNEGSAGFANDVDLPGAVRDVRGIGANFTSTSNPVEQKSPLSHPVAVHFYRAVVGHMDVWRQRMDQTTNWAAATTAVMVTFTFGTIDSPHFVLLLAIGFDAVFLLMESRRYQIFDVWRRRFRVLNRYLVTPVLSGAADEGDEAREALRQVAVDLGRLVPDLPLYKAVGYRVRRNYGYLFLVGLVSWILKLEVHPSPAEGWSVLIQRASVGTIPGSWVMVGVALLSFGVLMLALRAPSEQMLDWAELPSPLGRFMSRSRAW